MELKFTIYLSLVVVAMSGCCGPMECKPAKLGFETYKPLILALNKFKNENQEYPNSLNELVPQYINVIPESPTPNRSSEIEYEKFGKEYELKFSYGGPGMNFCRYGSSESAWNCLGYY